MIPTFRPWTHTSDGSYIHQLSLVVATATVSFSFVNKEVAFDSWFLFREKQNKMTIVLDSIHDSTLFL